MNDVKWTLSSRGMSVREVVVQLVKRRDEIDTLTFAVYRVHPNVEKRIDRGITSLDRALARTARKLVAKCHIPFWAGVLVAYMESPGTSGRLIKEILRHDKRNDYQFEIEREKLTISTLDEAISNLGTNFVLALCSKVKLNAGEAAHIPMVDFRCEPSEENMKKVKHALKRIGRQGGILLNSGRSFHYYGLELLSEEEWRIFMGRCLLLSPMIDSRYVAHRLIDGYCRLRISTSREKPKMPEVVDVF